MLRIGLLSATVCAGVALLPVALSGQQVPVGALLSINVSPSAPTRSVGQQAILSANGIFTGGVRQLGGGGNMPRWSFILSPSMAVAVCATPPASPSFGGQVIGIRDDGTFQETWSPMTPIVSASGTWTPANVHVDLKCVDQSISTITGVMDVAWTGTQYDGTFSTCTQPVSCRISSITSSEPANGLGDGDTAPDWNITGDLTAQLRAERAGDGGGRAYTIVTACSNSAGTAWHASVVTVPQYR